MSQRSRNFALTYLHSPLSTKARSASLSLAPIRHHRIRVAILYWHRLRHQGTLFLLYQGSVYEQDSNSTHEAAKQCIFFFHYLSSLFLVFFPSYSVRQVTTQFTFAFGTVYISIFKRDRGRWNSFSATVYTPYGESVRLFKNLETHLVAKERRIRSLWRFLIWFLVMVMSV